MPPPPPSPSRKAAVKASVTLAVAAVLTGVALSWNGPLKKRVDFDVLCDAKTFVAVNTTGYTSCEVAILDVRGRVSAKSPNWSTEPGTSNGQLIGRLATPGNPTNPVKHDVKITMQPTRAVTPRMAMALTQANPVSAAAVQIAGCGPGPAGGGWV